MKQIELPIHYFTAAAKREYSNWRHALPREFFQNSFDAHADEFKIDVEENETHTILSVADNGYGMSREDCESKLLTMGGSGKSEAAVGGFGVAKGLLFFAWEKWQILSRNYRVEGQGCQYEICETDDYICGVRAKIYINKNDGFKKEHVTAYLARCETKL